MEPKRTFYINDHGGKEKPFENALKKYGWKKVGVWNNPDVCLFDADGPLQRNELIAHRKNSGSKIVLYPHTAVPPYWYDCGMKWSECVDLNCIQASGHLRILKLYGYTRPVKIVGWSFCEMLEPRYPTRIRSVLFAPKHHNANGFLARVDKDANLNAYERLLTLQAKYKFTLIVRHIGQLSMSGLRRDNIDGVQYTEGHPNLAYEQIDHTDLVVATHTFAYLALARGCPTMMFGEDIPPHTGQSESELRYPARWDEYKEFVRYPFDLLDDIDPWENVHRTINGSSEWVTWKNNMLSFRKFEPSYFNETMKNLLESK